MGEGLSELVSLSLSFTHSLLLECLQFMTPIQVNKPARHRWMQSGWTSATIPKYWSDVAQDVQERRSL